MNKLRKYLIRSLLILGFIAANHILDGGPFDIFMEVGPAVAQQNLIVATTLTAAIPVPSTSGAVSGPPSATPGVYGLVQLASATGITGYTLNPTNTLNVQKLWVLYIDREEIAVIQINGTVVYGLRGYNSTVATSHASGSMVLYGLAAWFYNVDPGAVLSQGGPGVSGGTACTPAQVFASPWVNVRNGAQWLCSSITNTYVPGFNNPTVSSSGIPTAAVASATTIVPSGPLFHLTGTTAVVTITPPVGCAATTVGGCVVNVICDAVCSWTAAGNITTASGVVVAGTVITFWWNAGTSKWIPNVTT